MTWLNPLVLAFLPLAGFLLFLAWRGELRAAARRQRLAAGSGGPGLVRKLRPGLLPLALACLILALARPVWDPQPVLSQSSGQDTVFLVDVSRSMDTPDLQGGSRLSAVRQALLDVAPDLQGDRAALVAFAGTTVVKCPLSSDIGFFRQAAAMLDSTATSRGGTLLGDALRLVKKHFYREGQPLTVWVFTDGGDQESFPVEAARDLGSAGIRLHVWGVGTTAGGQVPGREVMSGLNAGLLEEMARAVPGGTYWGPELPVWHLPARYREYHQDDQVRPGSRVVWQEGAWWLLWPAGLCLVADWLLRVWFRRRLAGNGASGTVHSREVG